MLTNANSLPIIQNMKFMFGGIMESKVCSCCKEVKPIAEFGKWSRSKDGYRYSCKSCRKLESKDRYERKSDQIKKSSKDWYNNNVEYAKQYRKSYYANQYREEAISNAKEWKRNNPGKVNYYTQTRRANIKQRTPAWADMCEIKKIYEECDRITKMTGIQHHVDHIVPLQGEIVSGLHIHTNLQIITATENYVKNNNWSVN